MNGRKEAYIHAIVRKSIHALHNSTLYPFLTHVHARTRTHTHVRIRTQGKRCTNRFYLHCYLSRLIACPCNQESY